MNDKITHFTQSQFELESFREILVAIFPQIHFIEPDKRTLPHSILQSQTAICTPFKLSNKNFGIYIFECDSIRAKVGIHTELKSILKATGLDAILAIFHTPDSLHNAKEPHPKSLPQGEGLAFDSTSLARGDSKSSPSLAEVESTCPPSLAEGALAWVDSHTPSLRTSEASAAIHTTSSSQDLPSTSRSNLQNKSIDCHEDSTNPLAMTKKAEFAKEFRLSLITSGYDFELEKPTYSNLKRQSFILGHTKTATAQKALQTLIDKAQKSPITQKDLEEAFSQEPVSKEFYKEIKSIFDSILTSSHIPLDSQAQKEFAIKLLGRILFISFLKELHIVPSEIFKAHKDYYQTTLAPLFFEVLNTPMDKRHEHIKSNPLFANIPYLNGGLFSPSALDCYHSSDLGAYCHIKIPDSIFESIFDTFSHYHFTIDEQSPIEQEVALDPEMLGQIFENLLAEIDPNLDDSTNVRKATGSFYTPRNIVSFMCKNAILECLKSKLDSSLHNPLNALILHHDSANLNPKSKAAILSALNAIKILDLFCGSGAFPLGILHEIIALQDLLDDSRSLYMRKLSIIQNQIYGVDIQPIATEISRLRCFLSLIIESHIDLSKPNCGITPLPNLEFKFISANSFIKLKVDKSKLDESYPKLIQSLKDIAKSYFTTTDSALKSKLKDDFYTQRDSINDSEWLSSQTIRDIAELNPFDDTKSANFFDSGFMFGLESFDICIGNPPYISTKGKAHQQNKSTLLDQDGFFDDAYNHAFFSAFHAVTPNGIISLITPKTFWTINTKANLRKLLLDNSLHFICDSANPFYAAMVDTCITQFAKRKVSQDSTLRFIDATKDFDAPKVYQIAQSLYQNANSQAIFKPSAYNLALYKKFNEPIKALMSRWWSKIDTSAKISKNHLDIQSYRDSLKDGDLTLLGLITDGGQGLATANNGRFIAVRFGSKEATRTKDTRAEKLFKAKQVCQDLGLHFKDTKEAFAFLDGKSENEIWEIFDSAKAKFGRDIFGQGFIYRIVCDELIADISNLSDDEKRNGIDSPKCFVPYDKGDKDGNRWYLPTPYYIAWSVENVRFLKENSGKTDKGMPVVRNPQFYFKEGFCWNNVLLPKNEESMFIKCRIKWQSVNDVASMSLYAQTNLPNFYFVALLNSKFMYDYLKTFINASVNLQINDFRQIPIIIPSKAQLVEFESLFDIAYKAQKDKFERGIDSTETLKSLQPKLDSLVYQLYGIDLEAIKNLS